MTRYRHPETVAHFESLVRAKARDTTMVSLIIDSPWMPGYAGIDTIDFFFEPGIWLETYIKVRDDLPGVMFVPGAWVEFGMAAEPSGWGVTIQWHSDSPPSLKPFPGGLDVLAGAALPDPESDGLMPVVLRQYERMKPALEKEGLAPRMAAARGPLAVASHLMGVTEFLMALKLEPEKCRALLEKTTALCIRWLECQLGRMDEPIGVLVLDDIVGMLGPADAGEFAFPCLTEIFSRFDGMIRIYHNDTPNDRVFEGLSGVGIEVFNFTHLVDPERARQLLGPEIVLMGNLPPLDLLVRGTPDEVRRATEELMGKIGRCGPLLVSPGGGVSPGTPIENLKALVEIVGDGSGC